MMARLILFLLIVLALVQYFVWRWRNGGPWDDGDDDDDDDEPDGPPGSGTRIDVPDRTDEPVDGV